jgi:hypothetical protein
MGIGYGYGLSRAYFQLIKDKEHTKKPTSPNTSVSTNSDSSEFCYDGIFEDDKNNYHQKEILTETMRRESFEIEVNAFRIKIKNEMFVEKPLCTKLFWKKNSLKFPMLYKLALVLLNIQSSSAFIERFFSICGVVCTRRATNMKADLLIKRSMMKSNMHILPHLNKC